MMAGLTGTVTREDALAVAGMMVAARRVVPPERWVDWMVELEQDSPGNNVI